MSRLPQTGDKWHLPFPLGKFPVIGYHDIMTGKSKVDGLLVRLLYPAEDQNINTVERQAEWANWYPHENYKIGLTSMLSPRLRNVVRVLQYFGGDLHVPIIANAKPFSQRLFPVIIFSHGMSSNRTTYSNLCTQLASHGFIIAVIEHRDQSAFATLFPSEDENEFEWLPYRRLSSFGDKMGEEHLEGRLAQLKVRVKEIRDLLDLMENLNKGVEIRNVLPENETGGFNCDQFRGSFDMEKTIILGHSYGGTTALFTLQEEPRIHMGICLDAWMFCLRHFNANTVDQPILFINMEDFQCDDSLRKMEEFVNPKDDGNGRRKILTFKETSHTDVSDLPLLLYLFPTWITSAVNWVIPLASKVNPFSVHQATISLCLDFINNHLTEGQILDSPGVPEEIQIQEGVHFKGIVYS